MKIFIAVIALFFSTFASADSCLRDASLNDLMAEVARRQATSRVAYLDFNCPRDLEIVTSNQGTGEIFRASISLPRSHHCPQVVQSLTSAPLEITGPRLVAGCYEWGTHKLVTIRVSPIEAARSISERSFTTKDECEAEADSINR